MAGILIKNGRVWDGVRFSRSDILTDGELIAKIEPHIADDADYVYDADGKTVSAGLVDVHVHMRVHPTDKFAMQTEMSCYPFGVTAAADAGRSSGDRAILDSITVKSVIFVSADIRDNEVDFERLKDTVAYFGDRVVGIKVYFDTSSSEVSDTAPLEQICRFARERGLRVMVHCTGSPTPMSDILSVLGKGDILTHAFHGGKNTAAEDDFASLLAAQSRGVVIDTGFAGHVHTDFAVFFGAIRAGIRPDTISTDITKLSAYTRGGRYGMTMCMSLARQAGMSEEEIFRSVTSTPARILGKSEEWGKLRIGGAADIAVLEYADEGFSLTDAAGNHVESKTGYRCALTVADGQIVYMH